MSQSDKPEPPKGKPTVVQSSASEWARSYLGWIPGVSYVLGSTPPTSSPRTNEPESESENGDDVEGIEGTSAQQTNDPSGKEGAVEKTEAKPVTGSGEDNPEGGEEFPKKEDEDEPPVAEVSPEDKEEQARLKEQTRKVDVLRKRFEGVASKLIAVLGKLKHADFKAFPESADLTRKIAGFRAGLKKSLSQSHQFIANNEEAIEEDMKEAEEWAKVQTSRLAGLSTRKAELVKALDQQLTGADKVAVRGDADDKSDVTGAVELAEKKATKALAVLDFDKADAEIKRLGETLEAITKQIEEKFAAIQKRVEGVEKGDYARVYDLANEAYREVMEEALAAAKSPKTLAEAERKLASLQHEVESCEKNILSYKQAQATFPGIEKQYALVQSIKPENLADEGNERALLGLQKQLVEEWDFIQTSLEDNNWEDFSSSVLEGRFPNLLAQLSAILDSDGETGKQLAAAKLEAERLEKEAAAAAKLAADQLAEENRQRREDNKKLGLQEGDRLFGSHSNAIIKAVWKVTRSSAPSATNASIGGAYGYNEIMTAIGEWFAQVDTGLLIRTFVPGGGNIQDKRTKNAQRDEIQANFISDWEGNMINVHVNLRKADWPTYFPDRDL